MAQADNELIRNGEPRDFLQKPITPQEMLARVGALIKDHKTLEEQLRQAQKMEAIGRLAGGVAHDFNNLLTVITGFAHLAQGQLPPEEVALQLREIEKAAERAAGLTKQLLAFSRKQVLQCRRLDLNAVVNGAEEMLRRLIGENIALVTVLSSGISKVKADRGQLEQVIINLVVNARDAMPTGGRLIIETRQLSVEATGAPHGVATGSYVVLSVSDTGHGMDSETVSHIFEPFFTTKELGKGTGLGLSTVYGIVEQSGGKLTVESKPRKGSVFRVYLPAADHQADDGVDELIAGRGASRTGTVLVVEDETSLRQLICLVLFSSRLPRPGGGGRAARRSSGPSASSWHRSALNRCDHAGYERPGIDGPAAQEPS